MILYAGARLQLGEACLIRVAAVLLFTSILFKSLLCRKVEDHLDCGTPDSTRVLLSGDIIFSLLHFNQFSAALPFRVRNF
jgi:hypothetical protein